MHRILNREKNTQKCACEKKTPYHVVSVFVAFLRTGMAQILHPRAPKNHHNNYGARRAQNYSANHYRILGNILFFCDDSSGVRGCLILGYAGTQKRKKKTDTARYGVFFARWHFRIFFLRLEMQGGCQKRLNRIRH
jgi:hypothetical protein